jgi:hypothetical protein
MIKILDILLVFFLALIARDPLSLAELAERPTANFSSKSPSDTPPETSLVDVLIRVLESVSSEGDLLARSEQNTRPGGHNVIQPVIPKKDRTIVRVCYIQPIVFSLMTGWFVALYNP